MFFYSSKLKQTKYIIKFVFKELAVVYVFPLLFRRHISYAPQTSAQPFAEHPLAMVPTVDFLVGFYKILTGQNKREEKTINKMHNSSSI